MSKKKQYVLRHEWLNSSLSGINRQSLSGSCSSSGCMEQAAIHFSFGKWDGRHTYGEFPKECQAKGYCTCSLSFAVSCESTGCHSHPLQCVREKVAVHHCRVLRIHRLPFASSTMCSGESCCTSMNANPVNAAKMKTSRTIRMRSNGKSL